MGDIKEYFLDPIDFYCLKSGSERLGGSVS